MFVFFVLQFNTKINGTPVDIRTSQLKMSNYICHKEQKVYQVLTESVKLINQHTAISIIELNNEKRLKK